MTRCCCPVNPTRHRRPRLGGGGGFSLVELLVVIGIIAVLVGILIPVVGRMRREAYKVDTAALINTIRSACESYQANFKSYPGPFADADVYNKVKWNKSGGFGIPTGIQQSNFVTGAEQLLLSLCGGLKLNLSTNDVIWDSSDYVLEKPGNPPQKYVVMPQNLANLNPRLSKTYPPFFTDAAKFVPPDWAYSVSNFRDAGGNVASDTNVPEFVDRYPEALPILYLRARRSAPGIIGDGDTPYQYDIRQITGYTSMSPNHGLRELGNDWKASAGDSVKANTGKNGGQLTGADAIPYFKASGAALPKSFNATNQAGGIPRSQDGYILISAGPDRLYGTLDDITSFGGVE
jgi:prepilin-type N-terminal cleavage/methylation domain-containing protein